MALVSFPTDSRGEVRLLGTRRLLARITVLFAVVLAIGASILVF